MTTAESQETPFWESRDDQVAAEMLGMQRCLTFYLSDSLDPQIQQQVHYQRDECVTQALAGHALHKHLDKFEGTCQLRRPTTAQIIERVLIAGDKRRYRLCAWSILPNHVQVVIELSDVYLAHEIVDAWKSSVVRELYARDATSTPLWQAGYLSYGIKDERDYRSCIGYVYRHNTDPELLRWSSQRLTGTVIN